MKLTVVIPTDNRAAFLGQTLCSVLEQTRQPDELLVIDEGLRDAYRRAAVVAFAPVLEPFGFIPLEAVARETPVVGVREGGLREAVQDGVTGVLTDRGAEEFAGAIDRLLGDPALASRLAAEGRRQVLARWTCQRSVDELEGWMQRAARAPELKIQPGAGIGLVFLARVFLAGDHAILSGVDMHHHCDPVDR